ncbi:MAG: efflux RND transporter periplasmic adaptor subunit [Pseudomonadota bacterium]
MADVEQVKQPSRGARILRTLGAWGVAGAVAAGTVAVGAVALNVLYLRAAASEGPAPTPPLPVKVAEVTLAAEYAVVERFAGRVETAQETNLAFERGGLVVEIAVEEGDEAALGQVIARLDDRSLIAERDRLKAEKRRIETELALAQRTRQRQQNLSNKGFASEQRFDEAQATETALTAQIASIEAQLRQRDLDIEKSALTAPFDGLIAERFVDPGAVTSAGMAVARLLEVEAPRARVGLPPEQAASMIIGQRYRLDIRGLEVEGELIALRPDLAPGTRTVAALFDLEGALRLSGASGQAAASGVPTGEIVRLSLERRAEAKGVWLPLSAMQQGVKGLWSVYTVVEDEAASEEAGETIWVVGQEAVQALRVRGQEAYVTGSLRDGALVVVTGVNRVARGQRVRPLLNGSAPKLDEQPSIDGELSQSDTVKGDNTLRGDDTRLAQSVAR